MESRSRYWRTFLATHWRRALLACALVVLLVAGAGLRRYTWEETTHLRFQRDIVNGFYWGGNTVSLGEELSPREPASWGAFARGYLGLYDRVIDDTYEGNYGLDYPPLRLLV